MQTHAHMHRDTGMPAPFFTQSFALHAIGMNLSNGFEDSKRWFEGVIVVTVILLVTLFVVLFVLLRRAGLFTL